MTVLFMLHFTPGLSALLSLIAFLMHLNYKLIRTDYSVLPVVPVQSLEYLWVPNLIINGMENLFSGSCFWICLSTLCLCCTIQTKIPGEVQKLWQNCGMRRGRAGRLAVLLCRAFIQQRTQGRLHWFYLSPAVLLATLLGVGNPSRWQETGSVRLHSKNHLRWHLLSLE